VRRAGTSLIAGLIPRAVGVTTQTWREPRGKDEAMQRRGAGLASTHRAESDLGSPARHRATEPRAERTLDRSRYDSCRLSDRWNIDDEHLPLGPKPSTEHRSDQTTRPRTGLPSDRASRLSYTSGGPAPKPEVVDVVSSRPEDRSYERKSKPLSDIRALTFRFSSRLALA